MGFDSRITSADSEGAFDEYIQDRVDDLIEDIVNDTTLENVGDRGSDIVIEVDGIEPPRFIHDTGGGEGDGGKGNKPGDKSEKLKFALPFRELMERIAERLTLPRLNKAGQGTIKDISYEFKTTGPLGVILDKKRTFKNALKSSIATQTYDPQAGKWDITIKRKDRRFKLPEEVEKPKYKAVVMYIGDVSYSTLGERLEMEKRLVYFIQNWLDYNYGVRNVEHRFFVHDATAYEVHPDDFFKVSNAGGTKAAPAFELVTNVALSEYDPGSTNFYCFYFGDGETFGTDATDIVDIMREKMRPYFNRIGVVEVLPSQWSELLKTLQKEFTQEGIVRFSKLGEDKRLVPIIKNLFKEVT